MGSRPYDLAQGLPKASKKVSQKGVNFRPLKLTSFKIGAQNDGVKMTSHKMTPRNHAHHVMNRR